MFSSGIGHSGAHCCKLSTTFGFTRTDNCNKIYIAGNMYSGSERSSAKNKKHCCRLLRSPLVSTFATAHSRTSYGCSLQFIIIQFYFVCKFDILCDCIFVWIMHYSFHDAWTAWIFKNIITLVLHLWVMTYHIFNCRFLTTGRSYGLLAI